MAEEKRFARAAWQIMEQLLEVDPLEDALAGSLETMVKILSREAGAIWFPDTKTDRPSPLFQFGPADISNVTVENGWGVEGVVAKTGKSAMMVAHSPDIAKMADRVIKVRNGKIASIKKNMRPLQAEMLVW